MPTKQEALEALNSVAANHEGTFAAARAFETLRQYIESTARDAERLQLLADNFTSAHFDPSSPDGLDLSGEIALIFCFDQSFPVSADLRETLDGAAIAQKDKP